MLYGWEKCTVIGTTNLVDFNFIDFDLKKSESSLSSQHHNLCIYQNGIYIKSKYVYFNIQSSVEFTCDRISM